MQDLVRSAMQEGALGVGSALIYFPGNFADTAELTALAKAAAPYGGAYISHMRSEGDRLLEGIDELIGIAQAAGIHGEIYHLKAAGRDNWPKMSQAIARIESARAKGVSVSANMYTYTAGATGLNACMPPSVQEGGLDAWIERLKDPHVRAQLIKEMRAPGKDWENICYAAGDPANVLLIGFQQRKAQADDRQDARRGRQAARHVAGGDRDRSRHRGSRTRRHRVLPDERGQREARAFASRGSRSARTRARTCPKACS